MSNDVVIQTGDGCYYGDWQDPNDPSQQSGEPVYVYSAYVPSLGVRRYVHFPASNANCADKTDATTTGSSSTELSFRYVDESDGNTVNVEDWEYFAQTTISPAKWRGTNQWTTSDGETGTWNFEGLFRNSFSSSELPAGGFVCDTDLFQKVWTVTWTIGSNSCGDTVGSRTTENVEFVANGNREVKVYFQDGSSVTASSWNECTRTLVFSYDDEEEGSTTVTSETWVFSQSNPTVTSQYSFDSGSCTGVQSVTVAECQTYSGNACDSLSASSNDSSLSGGAIAGIVICVVLVLGCALLMILHCKAKSKQSRGVPAKVSYGNYAQTSEPNVQHVHVVSVNDQHSAFQSQNIPTVAPIAIG